MGLLSMLQSKKKSSSFSDKSSEPPANSSQSHMSATAVAAKDTVVSQNTDSPDNQRLAQKRILEASLFGDEEEEDSPVYKKTKPREVEDLAHMKDKAKTDKKQDGVELKAPKQSLEANGNSQRSLSKTPEPMSSRHLDDGGKSSKHSHSKQSSNGHHHHGHSKHHRSSHHSSASTKQTTPPPLDGKSAAPESSSKKDETLCVPEVLLKRIVSPLKLSKLPSSSTATQNHSTYAVDMKNLFGDDDDDDDDDSVEVTVTTASVTPAVSKDDSQQKVDHVRPVEKAKKHSQHGHKKTPEKAHSSKAHTPPVSKGRSDRIDVHPSKVTSSLSSSHSSDKHRRQHFQSEVDKKSRDASKSSGKTAVVATKPDLAAPTVTGSKPLVSDSAAKSLKVSQAVSVKKQRGVESGAFENDLSLSNGDVSDSSEANDVDVCDLQPEKPPLSTETQCHQSQLAATQLPSLSQKVKAANGEDIAVLLDLQRQLMSVADDETLEKLTTLVEETGKYSISTDTFDFDLCQLDIHTVNKLRQFLTTIAY